MPGRPDLLRRGVKKDVLQPYLRNAGPGLSPFNAWVLLKGLETLALRVRAQSEAAAGVARWLEANPAVPAVLYPGLESHPQQELARRQMQGGGTLVAFRVGGEPGRGLRLPQPAAADQDLQQSRRRQVVDHASGQHDALQDCPGRASCRWASPRICSGFR